MNDIENVILYSNSTLEIKIKKNPNILYVSIIDGKYDKDNFINGLEYYKNFWILVNSTNETYYQIFLFNDVKIYPIEFYDLVFKSLKSLEEIFKTNLHSSCLVNNSNAMDILRPLLNMYKAVRPFNFVKDIEEGNKFILSNTIN